MNETTPSSSSQEDCVKMSVSVISDLSVCIYILAFILGFIFNFLTVGPIFQHVRHKNVLGIFLLSLTFSDLLFIFTMPLWIDYYRQDHKWKFGATLCSAAGFFYYSNMYISIFLLCCISVNRCCLIMHPFRSKTHQTSHYRCAWLQCIAVYILVALLHGAVLLFGNQSDAYNDKNGFCYETFPLTPNLVLFNLIRVGVGFVLPLLVLALSYWKVLATVDQSPGMSAQAKRKVRLLSFGVIGIFSVCFAPYHILLLVRSLVFYNSPDKSPNGLYCQFELNVHFYYSCTLALSSLNCVVDPVLYVLVSNGVQEDLKMCWERCTRTPQRTVCDQHGRINDH